MKKTEYFMHQLSYNQWQQALNQVKKMRDEFISSNTIEKIIDEDIKITMVAGNQVNYVIKLTYY
jgi:hypothetical protein